MRIYGKTLLGDVNNSDTVTDVRLDLMSHVGVTIDLSHANMGFLKRKIQAKKADILRFRNPMFAWIKSMVTPTCDIRSSLPSVKVSENLKKC